MDDTARNEKTAYREMTSEFEDFEGGEQKLSFSFRKPRQAEADRILKEMQKSPPQAMRNLVLATVQPDQRDALKSALGEFPGVASTFANEILERSGFGSLGN